MTIISHLCAIFPVPKLIEKVPTTVHFYYSDPWTRIALDLPVQIVHRPKTRKKVYIIQLSLTKSEGRVRSKSIFLDVTRNNVTCTLNSDAGSVSDVDLLSLIWERKTGIFFPADGPQIAEKVFVCESLCAKWGVWWLQYLFANANSSGVLTWNKERRIRFWLFEV